VAQHFIQPPQRRISGPLDVTMAAITNRKKSERGAMGRKEASRILHADRRCPPRQQPPLAESAAAAAADSAQRTSQSATVSSKESSLRRSTITIRYTKMQSSAPSSRQVAEELRVADLEDARNEVELLADAHLVGAEVVARCSMNWAKHQNASPSSTISATNGDSRSVIPWQYPISGSCTVYARGSTPA